MSRARRLKKLVSVQEQLKALHEARRAGFLAEAASAEQEAAEIARRLEDPSSMSMVFPEVYHRRIGRAVERSRAGKEMAAGEAQKAALATARMNIVERAYREAMRQEERDAADRERLEILDRERRRTK